MNKRRLKAAVVRSLRTQGYRIRGERILPPEDADKSTLRMLHETAVRHQRERSRKGLERFEAELLGHIANGSDVDPLAISPKLIEVKPDSVNELLFRYARLHWSVPVSAGYGRRLRFLVVDEQNEKLIGILGLCDPVFNLGARDSWIGWTQETRRTNLSHVMDAHVL